MLKTKYIKPNLLIWGLTGSGKDTTLKILSNNHPSYLRLRLAETIKRFITETKNISFDELEDLKRTDPNTRQYHHDVDKLLRDKTETPEIISSVIRAELICQRKSMDFTNPVIPGTEILLMENPINIIDARAKDELEVFFKYGFTGIFLTRTTDEWKNTSHETENNPILDGWLLDKIVNDKINPKQIIIFNNGNNPRIDEMSDKLKSCGCYVYNYGVMNKEEFESQMKLVLDFVIESRKISEIS